MDTDRTPSVSPGAEAEDRPAGTATATEAEGRPAGTATATDRSREGDATVGVAEPTPQKAPSGSGTDSAAARPDRSRPAGWFRQVRGPLVIALALTLIGGVGMVRAQQLRSGPAAANRALVDADATARVGGDVSDALTKIFSYSHENTAATERAARDLLAGSASSQYSALFAQVKRQAPAQRLTVTTSVARVGVTRISGDTARLLVFLDQRITRGGKGSDSVAAAQLSVTARLQDGHWRIVDIRAS
jgi:Mce-associated membrane protein